MNDNEEKDLTYDELRALAEEQDRRDGLSSKARGQREKREEVSEEHLLSLGGKKAGAEIVFGPEGDTQLIFRPSKGRFKGAARWTVSLKGKISHFDTQRELSKANRGLFGKRKDEEQGKEKGGEQDKASDKEKDQPSIAFVAVRELLACHAEITELQEKAKQEAASAIEQEASEANYAHPKPEIETLREELDTVKKQLDTVNEQWLLVLAQQDAIALTVEALSKGLGKKMQIAFELFQDDSQWPQDIQKLQEHARLLAAELQWPPSKKELKEYTPSKECPALYGRMDPSKFAKLLRHAGLSWLRRESRAT